MGAQISFKVCPQCSLQAPLDAQQCIQCGHRYSTAFNPNQTQVVAPAPQLYGQHVVYPPGNQQPNSYAAGIQRDEFEWKVQVAWLWVLSALTAVALYLTGKRFLTPTGNTLPELLETVASPFVAMFSAGLLTFCALRLRRLYRYDAPHRTGWGVTLVVVISLVFASVVWIEFMSKAASHSAP